MKKEFKITMGPFSVLHAESEAFKTDLLNVDSNRSLGFRALISCFLDDWKGIKKEMKKRVAKLIKNESK